MLINSGMRCAVDDPDKCVKEHANYDSYLKSYHSINASLQIEKDYENIIFIFYYMFFPSPMSV